MPFRVIARWHKSPDLQVNIRREPRTRNENLPFQELCCVLEAEGGRIILDIIGGKKFINFFALGRIFKIKHTPLEFLWKRIWLLTNFLPWFRRLDIPIVQGWCIT